MRDDHHVEQAVLQGRIGGEPHSATVGLGVGGGHRVAGHRAPDAVVERDREGRRSPGDQRAQRPVGVDEISPHQPGLVGNPVRVGVKATAGDPDERAAVDLAQVQRAHLTAGQHLAGADRVLRDPQRAGQVVAPASGEYSQHAVAVLQRPRHCADQPVAAEGDGDLAGVTGRPRQLPGVVKATGELGSMLQAQAGQLLLHPGQRATGPTAAGGRVDDQRELHAVTSAYRSSAIATGAGSVAACACGRVAAPVSTIAPSMPAAAAPARSESSRSPIISDRPGPRRSSAVSNSCASGFPTLRALRSVAYSIAATIAPVPGQGPLRVGKLRSRPVASISAPSSTARVAIRSSWKLKSSWPAITTISASAACSVPLTIRAPASDTCRKIAGAPITYVGMRGRRSANTCWSAEPTVTISSSEARRPSAQSLRTYSSGVERASLVKNDTVLPALRSRSSAAGAWRVGTSPTQTQPSRSSRTCS